MKCKVLILILLTTGIWSCQSDNKPAESPAENDAPKQTETTDEAGEQTTFIVNIDRLRMRETAGEKGKVIKELEKGTVLYDEGEVSDFTTRIKLRGITFDEPWLKVSTADNTIGWIYAGAIHLGTTPDSQVAKILREKRLINLFGPAGAEEMRRYRMDFHKTQTAQEVLDVYRKGRKIREDFVDMLEEKIDAYNAQVQPDLFWLEEALPGFVPQLVAEGTVYYLFEDYRQWIEKAKATKELVDDQFVEFKIQAFPMDSIEYFFSAWQIQTWDYGGSSLLGRGFHFALLKEADQLIQNKHPLQAEITEVKKNIVEDILQPSNTFWESKDKVLIELDNILEADLAILDRNDKIALKARREQFDDPEGNGIKMNERSGG
ncbi:MAG: SH3 domain-containing protein [Saprospiraceae bacterium]|nr:SH3 domain-containing protein [Saprospiraceae bacterium]